MMFRLCLVIVCLVSTFSVASAQNWVNNVFPIKSHDFGTVAVASKTEFRFPVQNTLNGPIQIQAIRTSCGCTTAIVETPVIQVGQTGSILARFNTPTFRGKKGATITVVINQPFFAEVQLRVDGYIRSDMVFHPGSIELGTLNQGEAKTGTTKLFYAGRADWQVTNIQSNKPWILPSFKQTERGQGKANYELTVQIRGDAPEGFFQEEVIVQTNDRGMPRVPLRVSGKIESALAISPQSIALGTVKPGQEITQRLVLKGREPFTIAGIECKGWNVKFTAPTEAKKIHVFNVTISSNDVNGAQRVPLVISTGGESPVTAKAILTAEVLAAQVANN